MKERRSFSYKQRSIKEGAREECFVKLTFVLFLFLLRYRVCRVYVELCGAVVRIRDYDYVNLGIATCGVPALPALERLRSYGIHLGSPMFLYNVASSLRPAYVPNTV